MKTILVTGAGGFIGRPLVQALRAQGHRVLEQTSQMGDICAEATLRQHDDAGVDHVFHLAGKTYVPDSWVHPAEFQRVNVQGTAAVLEFCRRNKSSLTFISAYLYGVPASLPIKESDRVVPNNPYALSKYLAEEACRFYADFYGLPVTILRPFNIFGVGQKPHFLIPEIIQQVRQNQPIRLKDLAPRRDYLYLDDLTAALVSTLHTDSGCKVYNIGYGSSLSVAEIVEVIQSVAGTALPVISENMPRHNEISDVYADISQAAAALDWRPKFSFEQGVRAMFADLMHQS